MPIQIIFYIFIARYVFSNTNIFKSNGVLQSLGIGSLSSIISNPYTLEKVTGLIRSTAPLASQSTVNKVNTYLPILETVSSILCLYTFVNRVQNYAPIKCSSATTAPEKLSELVSNGTIPVGKLLAQPLIANNLDKLAAPLLKQTLGNVDNNTISELMSLAQKLTSNGDFNIGDLAKQASGDNGFDIEEIAKTIIPLINNN